MSFTDPYHTVDGVSRGFDIYRRDTDPSSTAIANYKTSSMGAGIRYGFPIAEDNPSASACRFDSTKVKTYANSPLRYKDFVKQFGSTNTTLAAEYHLGQRPARQPDLHHQGNVQRAYGEIGLPGGDLKFYKLNYQHQKFFPLTKDITLMLNGEFGFGDGYGGEALPFFRHFYAGGIGSVRGFKSGSLGPHDLYPERRRCTWRQQAAGRQCRIPHAHTRYRPGQILPHFGGFIDAGYVWATSQKMRLSDLRYSIGVSVAWSSPFGPLKFSIAQPLNKKVGRSDRALPVPDGNVVLRLPYCRRIMLRKIAILITAIACLPCRRPPKPRSAS
jgi:outer membrane protein insertion porin family